MRRAGGAVPDMHERTIQSRQVFDGIVVRVEHHEVELENGLHSRREIVRHRGAVGVLARRPDGRFLFVRQYRKAVEQVLLEVVAGVLDPGEAPLETARRELREETGYRADALEPLGVIYPSPGYLDEHISAFAATVPAEPGPRDLDHDERLEVVALTGEEFEAMLRRGEVVDAKTLALWALYRAGGRPV